MIRYILSAAFIIMGIYILRAFMKSQSEYEKNAKENSELSEFEFKKLRKKITRRYLKKAFFAMLIFILLVLCLLIITLNFYFLRTSKNVLTIN